MDSRPTKAALQDLKSLTPKHRSVLHESGILNLRSISEMSVLELKTLLDTTLNKASAILKQARDNLPPFIINNAAMILKKDESREYLSLNCKALDDLLGGKGLESGSVTEVYAPFGSGKSQIAFSAVVSALSKTSIYPEGGSAIVIDTEDTCDVTRIKNMFEFYIDRTKGDVDAQLEEALSSLYIVRPYTSEEQRNIMKLFLENEGCGYTKYCQGCKPLRLLVVDSLTALFRSEYIGRGVLAQKQQKLNDYLRDLVMFATKNNIPVLVTNQVMNSPDPFVVGAIACGGHIVAHTTKYRIELLKRKQNYRIAKMIDSSRLPNSESVFKIGKRGVIDVEDPDLDIDEYGSTVKIDEVHTYDAKELA